MRTNAPEAFDMTFDGPEGKYTLHYRPTDDWDGAIDLSMAGHEMRWNVDNVDEEENGVITLGGMTSGTHDIWNDIYWFELRLNDQPPVIRYWGDRVVWREDVAVIEGEVG